MPHVNSIATGKAGEAVAETFLIQQGLTLVARNVRGPFGEIDLIMRDADRLVFIEVKQRKSTAFGAPVEMVTASKQKKILQTAAGYLQHNNISGQQAVRFDVVGIINCPAQPPQVNWIKDAFIGE